MAAPRLAAAAASTLGRLAPGTLQPQASLASVLEFICDCLTALAASRHAGPLPLNESGLTQRLLTELGRTAGDRPYFFQKEFMEDEEDGESCRNDIAVQASGDRPLLVDAISFASGERFLALEAKRLPLPRTDRQREYLVGAKGGVERFKRNRHGRGLKTVAMLAYIQKHGATHWRDCINRWVDELIATPPAPKELTWDAEDKLAHETQTPPVTRFRSNNLRQTDAGSDRITMHHLWVQLVDEPPSSP